MKRTKALVMLSMDIPFEIGADKIKDEIVQCLREWSTIIASGTKIEVSIEPGADDD
jgi:hypothetical protein